MNFAVYCVLLMFDLRVCLVCVLLVHTSGGCLLLDLTVYLWFLLLNTVLRYWFNYRLDFVLIAYARFLLCSLGCYFRIGFLG